MTRIILALIGLGLLAAHAHAAPGDVDPTFGDAGVATISTGGASESTPQAIARTADGALLVAGFVRQSDDRDDVAAAIVRLLPDGRRDPAFGDAGELILTGFSGAIAIAAQSGGRFVVAVVEHEVDWDVPAKTYLLRFTATGEPDPTFGDDGRVDVGALLPSKNFLGRLASAGDDRIVLLLWPARSTPRAILVRLDADGAFDPSFGTAGTVELDVHALTLSVSRNGRVLIGAGDSAAFTLARFRATGAPDLSFGSNGRLASGWGISGVRLIAAARRADGRLLVTSEYSAALLEPDGSVVASFGDQGRLDLPIRYPAAAVAVAYGPDDAFAVAGVSMATTDPYAQGIGAWSFDATGAPIESFGDAGAVRLSLGATHDDARDLSVGPDGRIAVAIAAFNGGRGADLGLARLTADGSPDPEFGTNGVAPLVDATTHHDDLLERYYVADHAESLVRLQDGRLVVIGQRTDNTIPLARFRPDGAPDGTLAPGARLIRHYGHDGRVAGAVHDALGRLVLVGSSESPPYEWITRLGTDLAPDSTFGGTGTVRGGKLRGVALQSDGRILGAGAGVWRLGPLGGHDTTFGRGGLAEPAPGLPSGEPTWRWVLVHGDDAFTVVGWYEGEILIARYRANGLLAGDFGQGGVTRLQGLPADAALQADGKVLVLADLASGIAPRQLRVLRFGNDGRLDASFGDGGAAAVPFADGPATIQANRQRVAALAVAPDGDILVAGSAWDALRRRAAVVRLEGDAPSTCGNGAIEPGEDCDDANRAAGDGCDASCAIETCHVCRGAPSACGTDALDADADGACDAIDVCPATRDVTQKDADGDGIGDACDRCPSTPDPAQSNADRDPRGDACDLCPLETPFFADVQLQIGAGAPGRGRFFLTASFPYYVPALDPIRDGFRLLVRDASGAVALDVDAAPGAYDPATGTGWRRSRGASPSWRFSARSPLGGVVDTILVKPTGDFAARVIMRGGRASITMPTNLPLLVSPLGRDPEYDGYPTPDQCAGLQLDASPPAPSRNGCTLRNGGRALVCRTER